MTEIVNDKFMVEFWKMGDYGSIQHFTDTEKKGRDWLESQIQNLNVGEKYGYRIYQIIAREFDKER